MSDLKIDHGRNDLNLTAFLSEGEFQVRHVEITTYYSSSASLSGKPSLFCRDICWIESSVARLCHIIAVSCGNESYVNLDVTAADNKRSRCVSTDV